MNVVYGEVAAEESKSLQVPELKSPVDTAREQADRTDQALLGQKFLEKFQGGKLSYREYKRLNKKAQRIYAARHGRPLSPSEVHSKEVHNRHGAKRRELAKAGRRTARRGRS